MLFWLLIVGALVALRACETDGVEHRLWCSHFRLDCGEVLELRSSEKAMPVVVVISPNHPIATLEAKPIGGPVRWASRLPTEDATAMEAFNVGETFRIFEESGGSRIQDGSACGHKP